MSSSSEEQSLISKAFSSDAELSKEEISSILFVVKQILGLLIGIALGASTLQGMYAIIAYLLVSGIFSYIYVSRFLQVDEDIVSAADIFKESLALGLFNFMLSWVITYNLLNHFI